jgi:hypothetical protein
VLLICTYVVLNLISVHPKSDLEPHVIDGERRKVHAKGEDCLVSVDCTDSQLDNLTSYLSPDLLIQCLGGWFSCKINRAGLRKEVGLSGLEKGILRIFSTTCRMAMKLGSFSS